MEPVNIQELRTQRAGIETNFRGLTPDESGEPTGELVDITLVVPPLNFDSLQRLQNKLAVLGTSPTQESMGTLVEALEHALRRNYRNVPRWLISQTVDPANMPEMVVALMDVSGMKRKEIEEEKKTRAATASQASPIGTTSTPT